MKEELTDSPERDVEGGSHGDGGPATDAVVVDASGWNEAARVTSSIVVVVTVHARRRDGAQGRVEDQSLN